MELYELRCQLRFEDGKDRFDAGDTRSHDKVLVLDANLLHSTDGSVVTTQVVAAGAPAWWAPGSELSYADKREWDQENRAWESIVRSADWELAPATLPLDATRSFWGVRLAEMLDVAIGEDVLNTLFIDYAAEARVPVRLVFRADDDRATALPFETLAWREERPADHSSTTSLVNEAWREVSILRVADFVDLSDVPRLGAHIPGIHHTQVVFPNRSGRDGRDFVSDVQAATSVLVQGEAEPFDNERNFPGSASKADLVLVVGHGKAPHGLQLEDGYMSGRALATRLRGAHTVVLAMCGSAHPADALPDPTRAVARAGIPLTIGFQGRDLAERSHACPFVRVVAEALRGPLADERATNRVDLRTWETAIMAGRRHIDSGGVVPVVYVHPALLLAAGPKLPNAYARVSARHRARRSPSAGKRLPATTEKAWCVPGQLVLATDVASGMPVRVPLPVHVGITLNVQQLPGTEPSSLIGHHTSQLGADVGRVLSDWGVSEALHLRVTVTDDAVPRDAMQDVRAWARHAAELAALVRAIEQIVGVERPPKVAELVNKVVHQESATHGPGLSFVSATDGHFIRGIRTGHSWLVELAPDAPHAVLDSAAILTACRNQSPEALSALADKLGDPDWWRNRLSDQNSELYISHEEDMEPLRQTLGGPDALTVGPSAALLSRQPGAKLTVLAGVADAPG